MASPTPIGNSSTNGSSRQSDIGSVLQPNESSLVIVCSVGLLLYIFAVFGDGMLISAFVKDVRMRTTTNIIVISHLSAELISSIFGIITHVSALVVCGKPFAHSTWCTLAASIFHVCMGVGFLSLVGITVDRYLAVVKRVHHKVTRARVQVFLATIWTLSLAYGIPWDLIFNCRLRWQYVAWLLVNCDSSFLRDDLKDWTTADIATKCFLFIALGVPSVIIAYTSFHILRTALKNRKRIHVIGTANNRLAEAYSKSAFTTVLIVTVYFLCLIPTLALAVVCEGSFSSCSMDLYFVAKVTLCFRSACYPVIYVARNEKYSMRIRRVFCRNWKIFTHCFCIDRKQGSNTKSAYSLSVARVSSAHIQGGKTAACNHHSALWNSQPKLAFVDLKEVSNEEEQRT